MRARNAPTGQATTVDPAGTPGGPSSGTGASTAEDDAVTVGTGPQAVDDEQVHPVLSMDDALQAGDVEAYLQHVSPDLQDEQRAWFQGVVDAPLDVHELRLDGVISQRGCVDDDGPCTESGTVAHVGLRHQFAGADPVPVLEQYRWVLADLGDGVPVLVEGGGRDAGFYGYPQLWDLGEDLAVLEGHHVSVLVQRSRVSDAETILDTLDHAAEVTLSELPWVAEGRERLVVQLAPGEVIEEHGWVEATGSALWLPVAPDDLPREPGRLSPRDAPVLGHLFLDLDLALMDLEEFGISPGGQTELRHIAAFAATWGEDPQGWPEDWILEGPAYWWSAVDDPAYVVNLQYVLGDHFALHGPPSALPEIPLDPEDPEAADIFVAESVGVATYIEQTYSRSSLVELVGLLIPLDQRFDADEIEQAYQDTLGVDAEELVAGYAAWTEGLPTSDDLLGPPPQGR